MLGDTDVEPQEYKHLLWMLAVNQQLIVDLTDIYDSATDAPAPKAITSPYLPTSECTVPSDVILEYRHILLKHGEKLRQDIAMYKRVRTEPYELSSDGVVVEADKPKVRRRK